MERDNMMHGARSAMNADPAIRSWVEDYLKETTRAGKQDLSDEEFEKYWKYHKPEIMHEGAADAIQAYKNRER